MAEESPSGKKLTIGIPRETSPNERRVALTPDGVKKYVAAGVTVLVEKDAGKDAFISDAAFENAGAKIVDETAGVYKYSDLVLKVQKPTKEEIDHMQPGSTLIAFPLADGRHRSGQASARAQDHLAQHGRDSAHHTRSVHGRPLLSGDRRRLQGSADRRQ